MFLALAVWFQAHRWSLLRRVALLSVACALLYFTHILVFGIFAVIVSAHFLSRVLHQKWSNARSVAQEAMVITAPFIALMMVFLFWFTTDGGAGDKITRFESGLEKIATLLSPTLFTDKFPDVILFLAYLLGAAALAFGRKLVLAERMALPLLGVAIVCLVMPRQLLGVWGVDFRFPPVLMMLAIACTEPRSLAPGLVRPGMAVVIAGLVAARVLTILPSYSAGDREFSEFRDAVQALPRGPRVLVSFDYVEDRLALPFRAYWNWGNIAIIERGAFVPILFTGVTQVRPAQRNRQIDAPCSRPVQSFQLGLGLEPEYIEANRGRVIDFCERNYWADWPANFDYLIQINPEPMLNQVAEHLKETKNYSFFKISKIENEP